jgi:glycine cleavage system H protein
VKSLDEQTSGDVIRFSKEHTWARGEDYHIIVGITDFAQEQLGEIIYIELPEPDTTFDQDSVFGVLESVKTASDLYTPISGKVIAVNHDLEDAPELVNKEPYEGGWMIKMLPADRSELDELLSLHDYLQMVKPNTSDE